jgi:SAM-dependent methyltransferase
MTALNLACGVYYFDDPKWMNIDWEAHSSKVLQKNLFKPLEFDDCTFDFIYTSHFIEHITLDAAKRLLEECHRVLKPNGVLRIVTPDFEKICEEYLLQKTLGFFQKSEYVKFTLTDQMTRNRPGGGIQYWFALAKSDPELKEFMSTWSGSIAQSKELNSIQSHKLNSKVRRVKRIFANPAIIKRRIVWRYCKLVVFLFPKWFRDQNVALCRPGERHIYMHDFSSLKSLLTDVGFNNVTRVSPWITRSHYPEITELDLDSLGTPRKGKESMYVEAGKDEI